MCMLRQNRDIKYQHPKPHYKKVQKTSRESRENLGKINGYNIQAAPHTLTNIDRSDRMTHTK